MSGDLFDVLAENSWTLPIDDGASSLFVTELGDGPPVVALHAGPGAHYAYLVDAVRRSVGHARFVLFDQRGSLLSPVAVETLHYKQLVADLEVLRVALDQDRLLLFGHSWGSQLAQLYFLEHPERVAGMVLTGAMPPRIQPSEWEGEVWSRQEQLRSRPEVLSALRDAGLDREEDLHPRDAALRYRMTGEASFACYRIEHWRRVKGVRWNRAAGIRIGESVEGLSYDLRPALAENQVPVSVIQGDHDYVDPAGMLWADLAKDDPNVEITVIPDAGHNPWIDDPDAFDQALVAGLRRAMRS